MSARPGAGQAQASAPAAPRSRTTRIGRGASAWQSGLTARLSASGLLMGSVFVLLTWLFVRPVQDPDYWWHVTAGRWMIDHRSLPAHDLFTYTVSGRPWVDHEYLTEIGLFAAQQTIGLVGVSLLFGTITLAGFWLIDRRSRLDPQPYVVRAVALCLAAVAGSPFWGPRAQMLTFFFACLELYWLESFLRRGSRAIYWLPPVVVLWANLHGGFLVAFVLLAVAVTACLFEAAATRSRERAGQALVLAGVGLCCAAAGLVNPYTYRLFLSAAAPQASPVQQSLIVEWLSPDFHMLAFRPFEAMVLALVAGLALGRPRPYEVLLALATLTMALQSSRHIPIFVAACTPILVRLYGEAWSRLVVARGWKLPSTPGSVPVAALTALALVGLSVFVGEATRQHLAAQDSLNRADYPVQASDWLAAHPEVGSRMFNAYGWGGYLVYRFYPDPNRRVFVFGEATLMGDQQLQSYADVERIRPDWQQQLDKAGVDYVIFNRSSALSDALAADPAWRVAYRDSVAVIYVRSSTGANADRSVSRARASIQARRGVGSGSRLQGTEKTQDPEDPWLPMN